MRLIVEGVACVRSGRTLFEDLTFAVDAGEALAVTGPNGVGKSSLLRLVAGLLPKAAGAVHLQGGDRDLSLAEQAHYLGHRDALKPALTPFELLDFWKRLFGGEGLAPEVALARVGLAHARLLPSAYLSAGQRRRLAIARLLVAQRPLWLLDEPTSALDADSEAMFAHLVDEHLAAGGLVLVATHQPLGFPARDFRMGALA